MCCCSQVPGVGGPEERQARAAGAQPTRWQPRRQPRDQQRLCGGAVAPERRCSAHARPGHTAATAGGGRPNDAGEQTAPSLLASSIFVIARNIGYMHTGASVAMVAHPLALIVAKRDVPHCGCCNRHRPHQSRSSRAASPPPPRRRPDPHRQRQTRRHPQHLPRQKRPRRRLTPPPHRSRRTQRHSSSSSRQRSSSRWRPFPRRPLSRNQQRRRPRRRRAPRREAPPRGVAPRHAHPSPGQSLFCVILSALHSVGCCLQSHTWGLHLCVPHPPAFMHSFENI